MKFPRAEAEQRSATLTDLWEERGGGSWGYLVVNALRARELYVVRRTLSCAGSAAPSPAHRVACRATRWGASRLNGNRHMGASVAREHPTPAGLGLTGGRLCAQRDVQYLVREGEVKIIDRATGRVQPISRWTDGIHPARPAPAGRLQRDCGMCWQGCAEDMCSVYAILRLVAGRGAFTECG